MKTEVDFMLEISEYVNLNGVKQYILATGNENGPLMLFLHGGPGVSQIGFIRKYQSKLEEDFLVVNWDQRGAGKSNTKIFSKDELKINNIVNDAISLIEILRDRFKKNRIYFIFSSFHLSSLRICVVLYMYSPLIAQLYEELFSADTDLVH